MMKRDPFKYFKTSPEIIRLAVKMYVRFPLSLRNVEDLLHKRGIDVSHEAVRFLRHRVLGHVLFLDGPALQHVPRVDLVQQILRVAGFRGVFHGVEMIEIPHEFVEAVHGRQVFVTVALMNRFNAPGQAEIERVA